MYAIIPQYRVLYIVHPVLIQSVAVSYQAVSCDRYIEMDGWMDRER